MIGSNGSTGAKLALPVLQTASQTTPFSQRNASTLVTGLPISRVQHATPFSTPTPSQVPYTTQPPPIQPISIPSAASHPPPSSQQQSQTIEISEQQLFKLIQDWLGKRGRVLHQVRIKLDAENPLKNKKDNSGDLVCTICHSKKVNTLCSNTCCRNCCTAQGQWACNIHKTQESGKPLRPMSGMIAPQSEDAVDSGDNESTTTPASQLQSGLPMIPVPCPFCQNEVRFSVTFLRQHLHECNPNLFISHPHASSMTLVQLYEFSWELSHPGTPLPELYVSLRTLVKAQEEIALQKQSVAEEKARELSPRSRKRPRPSTKSPDISLSSAAPSNNQSLMSARISSYLTQIRPRINFVHLPLPQETPDSKAYTKQEYQSIVEQSQMTPEYDEEDYREALDRYEALAKLLTEMFGPTASSETFGFAFESKLERIRTYLSQETESYAAEKAHFEKHIVSATTLVKEFSTLYGSLFSDAVSQETVKDSFTKAYGIYWTKAISGEMQLVDEKQDLPKKLKFIPL